MTIYKLSKQTFYGGIGESTDCIEINYYNDMSKAIEEAKRLQKNETGFRHYPIVIRYPNKMNRQGWGALYTDLNGNEVEVPYDAYIITEMEVK